MMILGNRADVGLAHLNVPHLEWLSLVPFADTTPEFCCHSFYYVYNGISLARKQCCTHFCL